MSSNSENLKLLAATAQKAFGMSIPELKARRPIAFARFCKENGIDLPKPLQVQVCTRTGLVLGKVAVQRK